MNVSRSFKRQRTRARPPSGTSFRNATHCWDCEHLNGFTKKEFRGTPVAYRYDAGATKETGRRIFEFLEKTWAAGALKVWSGSENVAAVPL